MVPFDTTTRFKVMNDGLLYASSGVQTNCGGIAAILARIEESDSDAIEFIAAEKEGWQGNPDADFDVPGGRVPELFRSAVFKGALSAFQQHGITRGICFILIEALVHAIDARESKFFEAGSRLADGWLSLRRES